MKLCAGTAHSFFIRWWSYMKKTQWMLHTKRADFYGLGAKLSISPIVARILVNRKILENEMEIFLRGTMADIPAPELLKDAEKAADIILGKIAEGKKIRVIGDYDIDGITSTYILLTGLKRLGAEADYDIPDRVKDGYGLNISLVDKALCEGADTILTCDNGISASKEIAHAKAEGMTVIVTDHHEVPHAEDDSEVLPPADAVVDPKQKACSYPFKNICGGVVAFYLMRILYRKAGIPEEEWLSFLPFAAIATIGDVMPLLGENRILVREGLEAIGSCRNIGLRKLIEALDLAPQAIESHHIGFRIGPCLNASGRIKNAKIAIKLLLETDEEKAGWTAGKLVGLNEIRKEITEKGVNEAAAEVELKYKEDKVLVVYLPDCHESVAGIVAGRLRERYYRPVIVLTDSADKTMVKGSGRSIEAYDMFRELEKVKHLLVKFGGHTMAAGMSLKKSDLSEFRQRLNENAMLTEKDLTEILWIDVPAPFRALSGALVDELKQLKPYGQENPHPVFAQTGVRIFGIRVVGKNKNVVKCTLQDSDGVRIEAVCFQDHERFLADTASCNTLDILYEAQINEFQGRRNVEVVIKGWKIKK